jgi:hypothetical protein
MVGLGVQSSKEAALNLSKNLQNFFRFTGYPLRCAIASRPSLLLASRITMNLSTITLADRQLLEQLRIDRLRSFCTRSLAQVQILIDHNVLKIFCPKPSIVNAVLTDIDNLRTHARLILGVDTISVHLVA